MKTICVTYHTDATQAMQNAIDTCFLAGGGVVEIPAGDHHIRSIRLRSNVTLHLLEDAHLIASRDPEDYMAFLGDTLEPIPEEYKTDAVWTPMQVRKNYDHMLPAARWSNAVIRALDAENIAIIGETGAYIDGRDTYDEIGEELYRGPHAISMFFCKNVRLEGYRIQNSANWAHAIFQSKDITARNLTVRAGHDGIHLTSCDHVTITDCDFQTGDDCVAGVDNIDVTVKNCKLNTACSGFRFGGRDVHISECEFYGPGRYLFRGSLSVEEKRLGVISPSGGHRNNMLSAFLYYADFSRPIRGNAGNIVIENCTFRNVDRFLEYNFSGSNYWQRNKPLEDVTFRGIRAEGIKMPLVLYGDPEVKASLLVEDTTISFAPDTPCALFHICHFDRVTLRRVEVKKVQSPVLIKRWSEGEIITEDFTYPDYTGKFEELTTEPFTCKWI
ncbi:MAG: right-handed parallel beta-helix repeat-containing protein [Clostridia bacterium]|nr:right-handed parallel beta-helix repeat-containing protein [Clostridia bacterium]